MTTTRAALSWTERVWGRAVREVAPLSGGWTSTMLRLSADDGEHAVLRLMTKEPWRTHAPGLLARESQVQQQFAATDIPAPATIAVDPQGEEAVPPAHLMSRLPGTVELDRDDDVLLERLAGLLAGIHAFEQAPRGLGSTSRGRRRRSGSCPCGLGVRTCGARHSTCSTSHLRRTWAPSCTGTSTWGTCSGRTAG